MVLAVDVEVEVQVHLVQVVARGLPCRKPEQLRERDVIARFRVRGTQRRINV